jgi:hypothetical protein
VVQGNGWDISLGNSNYNNNADFSFAAQASRHWGGNGPNWGILPANTWVHLSLSRSGTRLYAHKDGVLVSTVQIPANTHIENGATTSGLTVGGSTCLIDDLLITVGAARHTTESFDPDTWGDSLMPMLPYDRMTFFQNTLVSSSTFTATGYPRLSTAQFVGGAAGGDFTQGSIATPAVAANTIGTRDFTIEFWARHSGLQTFGTTAISGTGWDVSLGNANYNGNADFSYGAQASRHWGGNGPSFGPLPLNTWTHLAVSRAGTKMYVHKDGVYLSSITVAANANIENGAATSAITVGGSPMFLDDVVVTVGRAKYPEASFTVSSSPFPQL